MKSIKSTFLLAFILGCFSKSVACGNDYYLHEMPLSNLNLDIRSILSSESGGAYWRNGFDFQNLMDKRYQFQQTVKKLGINIEDLTKISWKEIDLLLNKNIDFKLLSDFAWAELRIGNKRNAVKLLEALYAKHPNEYNVLANLGTAYEVTGDDQKALNFLRKAIAINPQSHYGSEWIHIKILEEKVKANPDYKLILDLKADENPSGWIKGEVYNKAIKPDTLMIQLAYQLHERISFVDAPDPIVGQLVKDFADLVTLTHSKKEAEAFYTYALRYDSKILKSNPSAIEEANTPPNNTTNKKDVKKKSVKDLYIGLAIVGLIAIVFVAFRRKSNTSS